MRPDVVGNCYLMPPSSSDLVLADDDADIFISQQTLQSLSMYGEAEDIRPNATRVMRTVQKLSQKGYFFEGADASVDLMLRRALSEYQPPFEILDYNVLVWDEGPEQYGRDMGQARATVKLRVEQQVVNRYVIKELRKLGDLASDAANLASLAASMASKGQQSGTELLEVAEGNGPVNALGKCLVKALLPLFPVLEFVELSDYKVRILDNEAATGAVPRVMIEFIDTQTARRWTTSSADSNIITASLNALVDGIEYMLEHRNTFVEREN